MPHPLPPRVTDETGHTYGRLTVIAYAGYEKSEGGGQSRKVRGRHAMWACKCECGARVKVRGAKLRAGTIVSCGCRRADPVLKQHLRLQMSAQDRRRIARLGGLAAALALRAR